LIRHHHRGHAAQVLHRPRVTLDEIDAALSAAEGPSVHSVVSMFDVATGSR
jgi:hypothetical protein